MTADSIRTRCCEPPGPPAATLALHTGTTCPIIAEMRLRTRPFIVLAVLALLVVPAAAMADIKPIPRPTTPPAPPPARRRSTR